MEPTYYKEPNQTCGVLIVANNRTNILLRNQRQHHPGTTDKNSDYNIDFTNNTKPQTSVLHVLSEGKISYLAATIKCTLLATILPIHRRAATIHYHIGETNMTHHKNRVTGYVYPHWKYWRASCSQVFKVHVHHIRKFNHHRTVIASREQIEVSITVPPLPTTLQFMGLSLSLACQFKWNLKKDVLGIVLIISTLLVTLIIFQWL